MQIISGFARESWKQVTFRAVDDSREQYQIKNNCEFAHIFLIVIIAHP
jgi:hypothetical protein